MEVVLNSPPWEEPRCGRVRPSMKTNVLLHKAEIGKVSRVNITKIQKDLQYLLNSLFAGEVFHLSIPSRRYCVWDLLPSGYRRCTRR
jgi:hypothetical protein